MFKANGKAQVNTSHPESFAICDRCGSQWNHNRLKWQFEWQGTEKVNLNILVCPLCLDKPNPSLKVIYIPADPIPIDSPRPRFYESQPTYTGGVAPIKVP